MQQAKKPQRLITAEIIVEIDNDNWTNEEIVNQLKIKGPDKTIKVKSIGAVEPEPA